MLALGLLSVSSFNGIHERWTEISVDLPQLKSANPIYAFPRYNKEMPFGGGSPCCDEEGGPGYKTSK